MRAFSQCVGSLFFLWGGGGFLGLPALTKILSGTHSATVTVTTTATATEVNLSNSDLAWPLPIYYSAGNDREIVV